MAPKESRTDPYAYRKLFLFLIYSLLLIKIFQMNVYSIPPVKIHSDL